MLNIKIKIEYRENVEELQICKNNRRYKNFKKKTGNKIAYTLYILNIDI